MTSLSFDETAATAVGVFGALAGGATGEVEMLSGMNPVNPANTDEFGASAIADRVG